MEKFIRLEGVAAPMPRDNVDTDAVIPIPWMKSVKPDYARALFANWRWKDGDGVTEIEGFLLNREPFRQAVILVAGDNFGCGSSREHAVWALAGFGIRCVIATSFGDIFFENCFKNGVLPLVLPAPRVKGPKVPASNTVPFANAPLYLAVTADPETTVSRFGDVVQGSNFAMTAASAPFQTRTVPSSPPEMTSVPSGVVTAR